MTQAVAYGEAENGQQSTSSGLILHRGPLSAALVRAVGSQQTGQGVWPRDGQGSGSSLELAHYPKQSSNIQSYDRDTSQWLDLNIYGKNISLNPQSGGGLTLPAGSAQAILGYYRATSNWSAPAAGQWFETAAQANATCRSGTTIRLEACGTVTMATAQALMYFGFMRDGALYFDTQQCVQSAVAGALSGWSIIGYDTAPLAGVHRYAICCYLNTGTGGFWPGSYTSFYVTEQRA
jgi:hypothetical protein